MNCEDRIIGNNQDKALPSLTTTYAVKVVGGAVKPGTPARVVVVVYIGW